MDRQVFIGFLRQKAIVNVISLHITLKHILGKMAMTRADFLKMITTEIMWCEIHHRITFLKSVAS